MELATVDSGESAITWRYGLATSTTAQNIGSFCVTYSIPVLSRMDTLCWPSITNSIRIYETLKLRRAARSTCVLVHGSTADIQQPKSGVRQMNNNMRI